MPWPSVWSAAADGIDAPAPGAEGGDPVAADDAVVEVEPVGVDAAAVRAAVPGGRRFALAGVPDDGAIVELGRAPDRQSAAPGQRVGLGAAGDGLGLGIARLDGHVPHGQVAVDGQHPGVAGAAAVPLDRDAVRQVRGVDLHVLAGVEGRLAVVPLLITGVHVVDVDLALEDRMLVADDGQQDGVAVERAVEGDGVARGRRFEGRPQRDRSGRRRGDVIEGIDHELRIYRVVVRGTSAGGEGQGQRKDPHCQTRTLHRRASLSAEYPPSIDGTSIGRFRRILQIPPGPAPFLTES